MPGLLGRLLTHSVAVSRGRLLTHSVASSQVRLLTHSHANLQSRLLTHAVAGSQSQRLSVNSVLGSLGKLLEHTLWLVHKVRY